MTVTRVRAALASALTDHRLDLAETRAVLDAAGGTVSSSEAKVLGEAFDGFTTARPGTESAPYATAGARDRLDELFATLNLPYGKSRASVAVALTSYFAGRELGPPLAKPPRTSSLVSLVLADDRADAGTRQTAFLHAVTRKTYLRVDGGGPDAAPRWHGPFDPTSAAAAPATVRPLPAGFGAERLAQLALFVREASNAAASGASGAPVFAHDALPDGLALYDLGVMHVRGGGASARSVRLLLIDDGRPMDELDRCFLKAEGGGQPIKLAGPLDAPAPADPLDDGKLTFPDRARSLFYRLSFADDLLYAPGAPPPSVRLERGRTLLNDASPYFVVPKKPDGTFDDPDKATEVYFRHLASGDWSGPHTLD